MPEVMTVNEVKTCRIVPKKYNYIPDLLLHNQRIEEETTMNLNKAEVWRAMMLADVYATVDGEEVLMTPKNYFFKGDVVEDEGGGDDDPSTPPNPPEENPTPTPGKDESQTLTHEPSSSVVGGQMGVETIGSHSDYDI